MILSQLFRLLCAIFFFFLGGKVWVLMLQIIRVSNLLAGASVVGIITTLITLVVALHRWTSAAQQCGGSLGCVCAIPSLPTRTGPCPLWGRGVHMAGEGRRSGNLAQHHPAP